VTVKGLDASKDFAIVSAGDQDLCARADGGLEDGERSGGEFVLLDLSDFVLAAAMSASWVCYMRATGAYVSSDRGFARSSL
jgi:hypothetical protein